MVIGQDRLSSGQVDSYTGITLTAGVTYAIVVESHDTTVLFDVHVFDEYGSMVSTSTKYGPYIGCYVTPRWTGLFSVKVSCVRGIASYAVTIKP